MKKILSLFLMCIMFVTAFSFFGCGSNIQEGPAATDPVTGNGSLCVRKGDYLYFVNGYVLSSSLSGDDNSLGKSTHGAIYRAKLENGELMYDVTTNEDGEETKTLKNCELLVSKVAGFEYTNLYIFGQTLYFTSPNTEKDAEGTIRFDLTDVFAVSISGGNPTRLVNALNLTSKENLVFKEVDGKVYLLYLSNNYLKCAKINGTKVEKLSVVSEGVTDFGVNSEDGFVYYTRSFKSIENGVTGNVLAKANLNTNVEEIVCRDNYNTYTIKKVTNKKIYYVRTNSTLTDSYVFSASINNFGNTEKQYTIVSYSNTYVLDNDALSSAGVVATYSNDDVNKLLLLTGVESLDNCKVLLEESFTVLGIYGTTIYGLDGNSVLSKVDAISGEKTTFNSDGLEFGTEVTQNFDYEAGYIYTYVKYTGNEESGYYLVRFDLLQPNLDCELVGSVLDIHKAN